ncbi:hypothetical protein NBO_264g0005 [Nosema bombycis CQ1]|uniref:Uncharacterized protein n=1 Tax=Nosema bombycis (strain CQ1 / CVCC 102059) TaxID=578461 RepID=R0KS17_NOSB1|nr:hypothetical protein NBO_264g0005 [Nosema bombycis CQ1]|eukprot:EOB13002.1 hypothetical protein NBO_264g0005 [Nosema bombycis CQ1]
MFYSYNFKHIFFSATFIPRMNRKKKTTKKFVFEPKIPTEQIEEVKIVEENVVDIEDNNYNADALKGKYGPLLLEDKTIRKPLKIETSLICLPEFRDDMKLVLFEDGTYGLRIGEEICKLDVFSLEGDLVVDPKECLYKIGDVSNYLIVDSSSFKF